MKRVRFNQPKPEGKPFRFGNTIGERKEPDSDTDDSTGPDAVPTAVVPTAVKPTTGPISPLEEGKDCEHDGKFRFQNTRAIFTYKHHISKSSLLEMFTELADCTTDSRKKFECYIAHESADPSHPYEHSHVVVNFGRKRDWTNSRFADFVLDTPIDGEDVIHPNIKAILSDAHWRNCVRYLAKEDPENTALLTYKSEGLPCFEAVLACETEFEALRLAQRWSEVPGIKSAWKSARRYKQLQAAKLVEDAEHKLASDTELAQWQKKFVGICANYIAGKSDDTRSIYWVYDPAGACGKSFLSDHLERVWPHDCLAIALTKHCRSSDIAQMIRERVNKSRAPKVVAFNVAKSLIPDDDTYTIIESLRDGRIASSKYKSTTLKFAPPLVLVLSNRPPNWDALVADRWRCTLLTWEDSREPATAWAEWRAYSRERAKAAAVAGHGAHVEGGPSSVPDALNIKFTSFYPPKQAEVANEASAVRPFCEADIYDTDTPTPVASPRASPVWGKKPFKNLFLARDLEIQALRNIPKLSASNCRVAEALGYGVEVPPGLGSIPVGAMPLTTARPDNVGSD